MRDKRYRQRVAAWLREQGHKARIDVLDENRALVHFRARGTPFAVRVDETDRGFLFLTLADRLPDALQDAAATLQLAREAEFRMKVVKIVVDLEQRRIEFNAEQLIVDADVAPVFWRCVDLLGHTAEQFFSRARELASQTAAQRFIDEVGRDLGLTS